MGQDYQTAKTNPESEANELAGVYNMVARFLEPEHTRVRDLATSYATAVAEEERPKMQRGQTSLRADSLVNDLRSSILAFTPRTEGDQVIYERELTLVHDMSDARRLRLLQVREDIPYLLWVVLVGDAEITVCFTYLFGLKSYWGHVLMVAALTLVVCGILFTTAEFDNPFSGAVGIRPTPFEEVLHYFEAG